MPLTRSQSIVAFLIALVATSSCTLFWNAYDLTGGANDLPDQGPTDAQSSEPSSSGDASGSHAPSADGGDGSRCSADDPNWFCDDFDRGPLGERWGGAPRQENGTLSLHERSASPPNALLASLTGFDAGGQREARVYLSKGFIGPMRHAVCDFDFYTESNPPEDSTIVNFSIVVQPQPDVAEARFIYALGPTSARLRGYLQFADGGARYPTSGTFELPAFKRWSRISLDVDVGADRIARVTVSYDQVPAKTLELGSVILSDDQSLAFGIPYSASAAHPTWNVWFDNIACHFER
jgi:hypothetical protein